MRGIFQAGVLLAPALASAFVLPDDAVSKSTKDLNIPDDFVPARDVSTEKSAIFDIEDPAKDKPHDTVAHVSHHHSKPMEPAWIVVEKEMVAEGDDEAELAWLKDEVRRLKHMIHEKERAIGHRHGEEMHKDIYDCDNLKCVIRSAYRSVRGAMPFGKQGHHCEDDEEFPKMSMDMHKNGTHPHKPKGPEGPHKHHGPPPPPGFCHCPPPPPFGRHHGPPPPHHGPPPPPPGPHGPHHPEDSEFHGHEHEHHGPKPDFDEAEGKHFGDSKGKHHKGEHHRGEAKEEHGDFKPEHHHGEDEHEHHGPKPKHHNGGEHKEEHGEFHHNEDEHEHHGPKPKPKHHEGERKGAKEEHMPKSHHHEEEHDGESRADFGMGKHHGPKPRFGGPEEHQEHHHEAGEHYGPAPPHREESEMKPMHMPPPPPREGEFEHPHHPERPESHPMDGPGSKHHHHEDEEDNMPPPPPPRGEEGPHPGPHGPVQEPHGHPHGPPPPPPMPHVATLFGIGFLLAFLVLALRRRNSSKHALSQLSPEERAQLAYLQSSASPFRRFMLRLTGRALPIDMQDYEEKRSLMQRESLRSVVQQEIREMSNAANMCSEIVAAEEGRMRPRRVDNLPGYERLPAYEEDIYGNDEGAVVTDGFVGGYEPLGSETSSVLDVGGERKQ